MLKGVYVLLALISFFNDFLELRYLRDMPDRFSRFFTVQSAPLGYGPVALVLENELSIMA